MLKRCIIKNIVNLNFDNNIYYIFSMHVSFYIKLGVTIIVNEVLLE